ELLRQVPPFQERRPGLGGRGRHGNLRCVRWSGRRGRLCRNRSFFFCASEGRSDGNREEKEKRKRSNRTHGGLLDGGLTKFGSEGWDRARTAWPSPKSGVPSLPSA